MSSKRHRIGVIGAGHRAKAFIGQLHAGSPRYELFGLCDIDADRLAASVEDNKVHGVPTCTDVEAFLADPGLDAVIVTVPEFAHAQVTCAAMRAGKPVYLEKPIAHTLDDCRRMLEQQRRTGALVYVGFNLRASPAYNRMRELVAQGTLGPIVQIEGTEQLHRLHLASFMRRFHRRSELNGGLLNAKCCHDLDIMMWIVGHEHRVARVSSFGGCSVFLPEKQPATHCRLCPQEVYASCPYAAPEADDLRRGKAPVPRSNSPHLYPGDLCVYTSDKDIVDNQTVILEWDHGVRGTFNLQGFRHIGLRTSRIWGQRGMLDYNDARDPQIELTDALTGDVTTHTYALVKGGHGGTDLKMMDRFVDAIERGSAGDSGLEQGLAATLIALKADESRLSGRTVAIDRAWYD
jgi:predicted dehydrogenase